MHGGAAVESMIMSGSRCPLILSASYLGSTSQMSPMCVWLMSNVSVKCDMHVSSISHQKVSRTVMLSFCSAREEIPMPVKNDRCSIGDVFCKIRCSRANGRNWVCSPIWKFGGSWTFSHVPGYRSWLSSDALVHEKQRLW